MDTALLQQSMMASEPISGDAPEVSQLKLTIHELIRFQTEKLWADPEFKKFQAALKESMGKEQVRHFFSN